MTSTLKRPWFRFHLLTAVLMMVIASGFVWALLPDWQDLYDPAPLEQFANPAKTPNHAIHASGLHAQWQSFKDGHFWEIFIAENLIAVLALAGIGVLGEYILRWREAREP